MTLLDEITAKCAPELIASRDHQAIADAVNVGRVKVRQPCLIGKGTIADVIGIPAGPMFIYTLKAAASLPMPDAPTQEQYAEKAMLDLAWNLIDTANFDIGLPSTRAGLDQFAGKLPGFSQASADAIKSVAEAPDLVTAQQVSDAMGKT
jgi:hypothetical protein